MNFLTKTIILLILIVVTTYALYPTMQFPNPPEGAVQSIELADTETFYRRAYFTNLTREEVIAHYYKQMNFLPTLRLNYPPEDAQTLIRDQTRSVYLEELVHPFRESLFINGFRAQEAKDDIWYKGVNYEQKITIRFVPTNVLLRLILSILSVILTIFILRQFRDIRK